MCPRVVGAGGEGPVGFEMPIALDLEAAGSVVATVNGVASNSLPVTLLSDLAVTVTLRPNEFRVDSPLMAHLPCKTYFNSRAPSEYALAP